MAGNHELLVTLDPELLTALKRAARHSNSSMAAAIRRALRRDLGLDETIDPAAPRYPRARRAKRATRPTPAPGDAAVDNGIAIPLMRYEEDR